VETGLKAAAAGNPEEGVWQTRGTDRRRVGLSKIGKQVAGVPGGLEMGCQSGK
jgi:hypothetical protein